MFMLGLAKLNFEFAIKRIFELKLPAQQMEQIARTIIKDSMRKHWASIITLAERYSGNEARCFHKELLVWAVGTGSLRYAQLYAAHLGRELTKEEAQYILERHVSRNRIEESEVHAFTNLGVLPIQPSIIEHYVKENLGRGLKKETARMLGHLGLTLDDFALSPHEMRIYECAAAVSSRQ